MRVGFNHNIRYKGDIFHIQTEDSGMANPHIITLLYRGGTIISSRKTDYSDIIKIENLDAVVEELMKDQHKDMLRRLKNGEFDSRAFPDAAGTPPAPFAPPRETATTAATTPVPSLPDPAPAVSPAKSLDEIILSYFASGEDE